ncbi:phage tail sheath family protein [Serratia entomophila]|uniref:phage tail sheath family protein n=1 Tax=Serratia entomophila TaxID=42906 RepID=UPI002179DC3C|nr:phage tail sheath C-terminal domain-containing protein [Serratia entomophila]CAI1559966.1 Phage tail sheath protein [Serratia entomophila]
MADYKVPGVYVEEPFGLSLSIQTGQTAVPVFAFDSANQLASKISATDKVTEFTSWLEVSTVRQQAWDTAYASSGNEEAKKTAAEAAVKPFDTDHLYQSLRLYFINGGGHCYIAPLDKFEELVPALDDATLLVQAGSNLSTFVTKVTALCGTGKTLFALFDGPKEALNTPKDVETVQGGSTYPSTPYAAVYYPWLTVPSADGNNRVDVPPSGVVAGVYARVDRQRGVWKAPANVEIIGASPKFKVSDAVDAVCNAPTSGGKAVNVIRAFRGTGPLIWGARTLNADSGAWRYVPVRRLFNAAERDIKTAMSMALFEPNSAPTWERVRGAVESYVHDLWRQGALLGESPAQAYFVHIGLGTTMTQTDINNGKMIVKVGLAAVRPAEFIVLQLTQDVVPA